MYQRVGAGRALEDGPGGGYRRSGDTGRCVVGQMLLMEGGWGDADG